jgi:hypothetical protein
MMKIPLKKYLASAGGDTDNRLWTRLPAAWWVAFDTQINELYQREHLEF